MFKTEWIYMYIKDKIKLFQQQQDNGGHALLKAACQERIHM